LVPPGASVGDGSSIRRFVQPNKFYSDALSLYEEKAADTKLTQLPEAQANARGKGSKAT
jgi:hypothetical protein